MLFIRCLTNGVLVICFICFQKLGNVYYLTLVSAQKPLFFFLSRRDFLECYLALNICYLIIFQFSPFSINHLFKSFQCLSKLSLSEQTLLSLGVWLCGIPFLQWKGWENLGSENVCVLVGLTSKSVINHLCLKNLLFLWST